jgi:hypothetical protein
LLVKRFLKARNNPDDGAVPKGRRRCILPTCTGRIKNRLIPVEPLLDTTRWPWLRSPPFRNLSQCARNDMVSIPKLPDSSVWNPCQRASTWWPPICHQDGFPNNEYQHLSIRFSFQQLLCCGGPPQASWSRRRQEQDHPGHVGIFVKGFPELAEILTRQRDERFLASRRSPWPPQIAARQEHDDNDHHESDYTLPFHFHVP